MANFPTWSKNFKDILLREGRPVSANLISFSGIIPSSRTYTGENAVVGYGNGFYCTSVVVSVNSNIPVNVQLLVSEANAGDLFNKTSQICRNSLKNQTISIPVNSYIKDFPLFSVYLNGGDGTTTGEVEVVLNGVVITDSSNWDANNLLHWSGDSITAMSGLPQNNSVKKHELHTHMINDYLISKGKDTRLTIVAQGGTTSSQGESARLRGLFDSAGKAKYYFYNFGTNDAAQSVASGVYTENIGKYIDWALAKNPSAIIIILGIPPLQPTTHNTNAIALRSAADSYVTGLGLSNVHYCELGNAFDRTDNSFYSSADTTGQGVHPNIAGMKAIYDTISAFLLAQNIA